MSPSECDVTLIGGGVVSRGFVVVGAAVVVGASVVEGAIVVDTGSASIVVAAVSSSMPVVRSGACVVAVLVSVSATRTASTADATRAEATGEAETASVATVSADGDDGAGEYAAMPITPTRAMTRRLAYASGIRGLTYLRGTREYFQPDGLFRNERPAVVDAAFSAR